jgi:CTP synthase
MKYIVVTGGVVSGLGKGITISSIGRILKASGVRVTSIKIDPYLNVDAGTMSPFEHGETFVLDDGGETDLDLGNYERFLDITLTARHNITSGKIYKEVINQERRGDYLGKTVQIVPHATDMVQSWIKEVARNTVDGSGLVPDVCLIEVGGTVGDIESMVFLEALRQFQFLVGRGNILFLHVSLVPVLGSVGEQKTKPTQHSVKELRGLGLSPDVIVCRSTEMLSQSTKNRISAFCHVDPANVMAVHDVSNIYHVPLILRKQGIHTIIKEKLGLEMMADAPDLTEWSKIAHIVDTAADKVTIAVVGKYTGLQDAYLSVIKSLKHAGILLETDVSIQWVEASDLEEETKSSDPAKHTAAWETLREVAGVVVPGGFGVRGVEGKVLAAKFCREHKKPFLGVCLGMQVMVIEYARSVLGLKGANSTEFDEVTAHPMVLFMPEINQKVMGGTMRLGARATLISPTLADGSPTLAREVYGFPLDEEVDGTDALSSLTLSVMERHRHRYEVNPDKVEALEAGGKGLIFSGRDDQGVRMEIAELPRSEHPFYFGTQFHPEFKSRPNRPSPPFYALVVAAVAASSSAPRGSSGSSAVATPTASRALSSKVCTPPTLSLDLPASSSSPLGVAGAMWRQYEAQLMMTAAHNAVLLSSPLGKRDRAGSSSSSASAAGAASASGFAASEALGGSGSRSSRIGVSSSSKSPRAL